MTSYLLDTNIVSNATKPRPSPSLAAWMLLQRDEDLFISSLTIAEIQRGILAAPAGQKRRTLETWFDSAEGPLRLFADRVLSFDLRAALVWARLMAQGKASGRPRSGMDTIIAAIAEANGCMVVTDNSRDFHGTPFLNPMEDSPRV